MMDNYKVVLLLCVGMKINMEDLIYYFKFFIEGFYVLEGEVYVVVEYLKGEFGIYFVLDGVNKLYCFKICVLGFVYLVLFDEMVCGYMIVDVVMIIGM